MKPATSRAQVAWSKLLGYAGINENKGLYKSDSLAYLREQHERTEPRFRDPRIAELLDTIDKAPPSRAALVEYLITLYRLGFEGCELSQELLCSTIRRVTHARRFAPRTLRDAAAWAAAQGLITISWIPIGTKFQSDSGAWKTRQIRRYKLTYKVRFLVSLLRVPKKSKVSDNVSLDPTLAEIAANPNGEKTEGASKKAPSVILLRLVQTTDTHADNATAVERNEVSPHGDSSTCPPSSLVTRTATCEHRASKRASRASAIEKSASRFAPRVVREHPRTYAQMRAELLHELFIALKPADNSLENFAYTVADCQTSQLWPEWLPVACSWWPIMCDRSSMDWHRRRKQLDRDIVPALRDFAAVWTPPQLSDLDSYENRRKFDTWEFSLCPPAGIAVAPINLENYFSRWPAVRRTLSALYDGRLRLSEATLKPVYGWIHLIGTP